MERIVLASASPRRRELLELAGLSFSICPSGAEEKAVSTQPEEMVKELARQKAVAVREELARRGCQEAELVIGADTVVAFQGKILGKPSDEQDAFRMLSMLQGRWHQVYTGVCVLDGTRELCFAAQTDVEFYPVTPEEIRAYIATGEPMDKAGSYGIQGKWGFQVKGIRGDYHNVMGLPVGELLRQCKEAGISLTRRGEDQTMPKKQESRKRGPSVGEGRKKACIFDLDGTLLYTLDSMARPANRALKELGLKELAVENYSRYCGEGVKVLIRRILADAGDPAQRLYDQALALYRTYFLEDPLYKIKPYPGILELLEELSRQGILLAVCSNKPHEAAGKVIDTCYPQVFRTVIGQQEGIPRKPAPDAALLAAKTMQALPEDCLYIGDSGTDMRTGKAAGMFTLGALWGYRTAGELQENGADALVESPKEILSFL